MEEFVKGLGVVNDDSSDEDEVMIKIIKFKFRIYINVKFIGGVVVDVS